MYFIIIVFVKILTVLVEHYVIFNFL